LVRLKLALDFSPIERSMLFEDAHDAIAKVVKSLASLGGPLCGCHDAPLSAWMTVYRIHAINLPGLVVSGSVHLSVQG
jgi:hypothetical protein